jgi:ElaA protein
MVTWKFFTWQQLEATTMYAMLKLRQDVFIIEQNCPYPDLDNKDHVAIHLCAMHGEECIAYARIFPEKTYMAHASIGRACTALPWRRKKLGRELMQRVLQYMDEQFAGKPIEISAQSYLIRFYESFGFAAEGEEYLEDGIPHRHMVRYPSA